jgi:DNA-binding transcriptional ArsR family regulator
MKGNLLAILGGRATGIQNVPKKQQEQRSVSYITNQDIYSSFICDIQIINMQRTNTGIEYTATETSLARYAKALSHPIRIRMLNFLESQACCFTGELTEEISMAQSTVSQHLKELKDAGLIQGDVMPPRIRYCINKDAWKEAKEIFSVFFEKSQIEFGDVMKPLIVS